MKDRSAVGQDICSTRRIQDRSDARQEGGRIGRIHNRSAAGQDRCSTGRMKKRSDARQDGCRTLRTGQMQNKKDAGLD